VTRRLALLLPWIFGTLVVGMMAFDLAVSGRPASAAMPGCHGAGLSGLPASLYYGSVAAILVLSFGLIEWRSGAGAPRSPLASRVDLLGLPGLRRVLRHPAPRAVAQGVCAFLFLLIIAAGLFGNQLPTKNVAPLLTWTVWWCGLIALVLFAGKAWCWICPWDAIAGWAEGQRPTGPRRTSRSLGIPWPRALRSIWPATTLFVLLTWVELGFAVTTSPRATAWLGLTMLGMAFGSAFVFDRKSFCRYGCLVGRISGLYSLFAPVEIRATDRDVCRTCPTRSCYHGSDAGEPCPTFQYVGAMTQNTYCITCLECVKTCEADNVGLRLRPWGADLLGNLRPRADEAYLALLLLALTGFHGLTMTSTWGRLVEGLRARLGVGEPVAFTIGMAGVMLGPVLLYALLVAASRWSARAPTTSYRQHFVRYAYALLPIALFYHLAHNSEHLFMEGPRLLALASDPFGWEWNLFGTSGWEMGPLVGVQALWAIQVLLAGALFSDPRAALRSQIPMLVAMVAFSTMSLWLLRQPMEMRTTWM
jgi:hypothetical protein